MSVFGVLIGPLFRPLTRVFTPKTPDAKVVFTFYPWVCRVQYSTPGDKYNNKQFGAQEQKIMDGADDFVRMATFLHYLAFYCYICDNRQRSVVVEAYKSLFNQSKDVNYDDFMGIIYAKVFNTLSQQEKDAANGLFSLFKPPPCQLTTKESDLQSFGTFIFKLKRKKNGFVHYLELNAGADMIFLPLSVGHLYRYLTEDPTEATKMFRDNLNFLSIALLNSLEDSSKSPSMSWQLNQPDILLRHYN